MRGMYRLAAGPAANPRGKVRLLGSGAILREVIAAAELLALEWNVESEIWSITSYSELAREARETERWNRLHPGAARRSSHVETCLSGSDPVIAASDYVRAYPELIASHVRAPFIALGTDGFGRSDTRAALRRFFEIDRHHAAVAALDALAREGTVPRSMVAQAIERYGLDPERAAPWTC